MECGKKFHGAGKKEEEVCVSQGFNVFQNTAPESNLVWHTASQYSCSFTHLYNLTHGGIVSH